jgi:hypothetical protein
VGKLFTTHTDAATGDLGSRKIYKKQKKRGFYYYKLLTVL